MRAALLGSCLVALFACALVRRSDPPRFFDPEPAARAQAATDPPPVGASPDVPLRIDTVHASSYRRDRIVWRASDVELGLYEGRRWTDLPSHYVERALARELYDRRGFPRTGPTPTAILDTDVIAFDELVAPVREAYVAVFVTLTVSQRRVLDAEFSARSPIAGRDPASVARAMGVALDDCAVQVGEAVAQALRRER